MSEGSRTDSTSTVTDRPKETGQSGSGTDASNRAERPQLAADKPHPEEAQSKDSVTAHGAKSPETHLPGSKDNPYKMIAEHPNQRANWERALEKIYGQGSYEKNIAAYRKELESLPSGSSRTPGTKQEHAADRYDQVRREFYKQEHEHPTYKYTPAQDQNLSRGNSPDYQPRAKGAGEIEGPQLPNRQIHHLEERSTSPERALDADNTFQVEGFRKGTTHYDSHHGEGAKRGEQWRQDVADGKRPNAEVKPPEVKAPEVKAPEVKVSVAGDPEVKVRVAGDPEVKVRVAEDKPDVIREIGEVEGVLRALSGKVVGVGFDIWMVRGVARDLEFSDHPDDPKWGNEYHDFFGNTYYRHPWGWSSSKDDGA